MFLWCVQEVAGLKEEDLPSEDSYPTTAVDSSSTLSESQSWWNAGPIISAHYYEKALSLHCHELNCRHGRSTSQYKLVS